MTNNQSPRTLTRSQTDKMIAGVCGGLAQYLGVDATVVRLGAAVLTVVTGGFGIVLYVVALIVMPDGSGRSVITDFTDRQRAGGYGFRSDAPRTGGTYGGNGGNGDTTSTPTEDFTKRIYDDPRTGTGA